MESEGETLLKNKTIDAESARDYVSKDVHNTLDVHRSHGGLQVNYYLEQPGDAQPLTTINTTINQEDGNDLMSEKNPLLEISVCDYGVGPGHKGPRGWHGDNGDYNTIQTVTDNQS